MSAPHDPHAGVPPAEFDIDVALVRRLLAQQHPDLADRAIEVAAHGWDNVMVRLGGDLCARLPRRAVAVALMGNEQRWLARLAPRLPLPVPAPVRLGAPSADYPWPWSICRWIEGAPADEAPPRDDQAAVLVRFLRALHQPAPADAPRNPVRGVPLVTRQAALRERTDRLGARNEAVPAAVLKALADGMSAAVDLHDLWLHGDMHPRNVLVRDGALAAIIDWGDLTAGDPATDLASIWMLLPGRAARAAALAAYAPSQATLLRARGWAAFFAIVMRDAGLTNNPPLAGAGAATMSRLADGP